MNTQNNYCRIQSQLSLKLFTGGFKQQFVQKANAQKEKPRSIREDDQAIKEPLKLVLNEGPEGQSQTQQRSMNKRKNSIILEQIQKIKLKIEKPRCADKLFQEKYTLLKTLGEGAHATVQLAINKETQEKVAIKICRSGDPEIVKTFIQTYKLLRILNNQFIVKAHEIFIDEQEEKLFLVMEFVEMRSLDSLLKKRRHQIFLEWEAKKIMKSLLTAIQYFHEMGIAHRDIKPDNIMVDKNLKEDKGYVQIKIIDFGVSKKYREFHSTKIQDIKVQEKDMWTRTGNYLFCAPEIFFGVGYNEKVDIWACGVILYQLLCGSLPFYEDTILDTIDQIQRGDLKFDSYIWNQVSQVGKDFIIRLLNRNPKFRLSADEALKHPWFYADVISLESPTQVSDDGRIVQKQQNFFERNKYQRSNTMFKSKRQIQGKEEQKTEQDEEEKKEESKQNMLNLKLMFNEDAENEEMSSPIIRLSKINKKIKDEIHINKKEFKYMFLKKIEVLDEEDGSTPTQQ